MKLRILSGILAGLLVLILSDQIEQRRPSIRPGTAQPGKAWSFNVEPREHTPPPGVPRNAERREFNGIVYYIVPVR